MGRDVSEVSALFAGVVGAAHVRPGDDAPEEYGHDEALTVAAQAPLAVRLTKSLFHAPRDAHPLIDDIAQAVLFETDDKRDRMTAFLDRRKKD